MTEQPIHVQPDTPCKGNVRIVATGSQGQITVSIEVDDDGFPVVDFHFHGSKGHYFRVAPGGDERKRHTLPVGDQLCVTLDKRE
jgi:hypothetical protein